MRFAFFLVVFNVTFLFSQTVSDTDFENYKNKVRLHLNAHIDSAFFYVSKIKESSNTIHLSFAYAAQGYLHQLEGTPDTLTSNSCLNKAQSYLDKEVKSLKKTKATIDFLNFKGLTLWKRRQLGEAVKAYEEAIYEAKRIGDLKLFLKCNNNMSLILAQIGNYKQAIATVRRSDSITDKIQSLYDENELLKTKSSIYMYLGSFYDRYGRETKRNELLDSSEYFYEKTILFSKNLTDRQLKAQSNLGNLYTTRKRYLEAEKVYKTSLILANENENEVLVNNLNYNLGYVYYNQGEFHKAMVYFDKVDRLKDFQKNAFAYIHTQYYLSQIFNHFQEVDKADSHLKKYLNTLNENEGLLMDESLKVNDLLADGNISKDLEVLTQDIHSKKRKKRNIQLSVGIGFFVLAFFLIWNYRERKKANKKVKELIEAYKKKTKEESVTVEVINENIQPDAATQISMDVEKENEIAEKLKELEKKLYFLREDFNLQNTAKKIKTNTTYLSYVVNQRFKKTFSEYSNELKINYAIEQMVNNPTFRKYSTQAIAEAVGYKNAVSFAKSFNKRTGVTPVQFIKKIENDLA